MRVKIGDKIKILGLAPDSDGSPDPAAADYVGREGVVEYIDDAGQEINIKDFNLMYNVECASGFHFFRTRKEAEEY